MPGCLVLSCAFLGRLMYLLRVLTRIVIPVYLAAEIHQHGDHREQSNAAEEQRKILLQNNDKDERVKYYKQKREQYGQPPVL